MAQALQVVRRAMRLATIIDASEALEAQAGEDALEILNDMLAEWHGSGIGVPDYAIDTLNTELTADAADREAMAYQLAARIAPEYEKELPPQVVAMGMETMARLRLRYFQPGKTDFSELPGNRCGMSRADFESGE